MWPHFIPRHLLAECISIRNRPTILEAIADGVAFTRNASALAEHVRTRPARQICAQYTLVNGHMPLISLSAD